MCREAILAQMLYACPRLIQICTSFAYITRLYFQNFTTSQHLTIRRGRVVYDLIVNEDATRVDYLFRDNEAELSNCFSIHSYPKYKL